MWCGWHDCQHVLGKRQVQADDPVLVEADAGAVEQVRDRKAQRRKQERPGALAEVDCLVPALGHADCHVQQAPLAGPFLERTYQLRLSAGDQRRGPVRHQCHVDAAADKSIQGAGEAVEPAGEQHHLVRHEAVLDPLRAQLEKALPLGRRPVAGELEPEAVVRQEPQRGRKLVGDGRRVPEVRFAHRDVELERAPPAHAHVGHEVGAALGELVRAVHVGGNLDQVREPGGKVAQQPAGDLG